MPETSFRFFIATPGVAELDRLDDTFATVVAQAGNFHLIFLVDDPGGALGIADRLNAWRAKAGRLRDSGRYLDIVVSSHGGLGDFDTLDSMLAELPDAPDAVLVPLPCGCRLAPGALEVVAGVLADRPEIGLVRGLVAAFGPHGVMTGLGFGSVEGTWNMIGAVSDGTRDLRDLPGGLFLRSTLWHRLGRLDPSLTYAGYVDLCSKVAVHARVGLVEAMLVEDRLGTLTAEDSGRQGAEIVRVRSRAARRQARLHGRMLDGDAEFDDLRPHLKIAYDVGSRMWQPRAPSQFLDPFARAEIESGFTDLEGPYPEAALPCRFRWTSARRASFSVTADRGSLKVAMRLRNPSAGQVISLELNGATVFSARPTTASLQDAIEVDLICNFRQGRNEMALTADVMVVDAAGQTLGLIVEDVEITGNPA